MTTPGNQELVTTFSFRANLQRLEAITRRITTSLRRVTGSSAGVARAMGSINRSATLTAASITALVYATGKLASKLSSPLLELNQIAIATDSAAEGLFAMSNGLKAIGANEDSIKALSQYAQDIVGSLKLGFLDPSKAVGLQRVGLTQQDLRGLDVAQVQALLASTILTKFPDKAVRSQIYRSVLGIGSGDLGYKITPENIGMLTKGADEPNDALRAAIDSAAEFNRVIGELGANLSQISINIANIVLPLLNSIISITNKILGAYNASDIFGSLKSIAMLDARGELNKMALDAKQYFFNINVNSAADAADVANGLDDSLNAEITFSNAQTAQR